ARDPLLTADDRATALIEDNDPCYLPNGDIIFISTRSQSFGRCHGGRYNPAWVLYRSNADGSVIRQLSFGNENEYEPAVLADGTIAFSRWEYTNRHEMYFHMLWTCNPDGSGVANFYGNDTIHPMMITEPRAIPGSQRVVATATGHHSYSTGTIVLIDPSKGENGPDPLTRLTPETSFPESEGWPSIHYSHPDPISEDLFLVSRADHQIVKQNRKGTPPPVAGRGIYLIDTLGGRELLFEDPAMASFSPLALRARQQPPLLPDLMADASETEATLYIQDVYQTRNDPEGVIKPGSIHAIRVNAQGVQPRVNRTACSEPVRVEVPKRILGTAPIAADGSVAITVPANTALQLQLLDEHGMAVMTERSFFYLQPGEARSCIGCHEPSGSAPLPQPTLSMRAEPQRLTPLPGPDYPGGLSFMRTVQPVLDRHCIDCHGLQQEAGGVNLVHDGALSYPRSYRALVARGNHKVGDKRYQAENLDANFSRPYDYGAHTNRVSKLLLDGHHGVALDDESWQRLVGWLDLNAQCYGDLFPYKIEERTFDPDAVATLHALIDQRFGTVYAQQETRSWVNAAQLDESRILLAPLPLAAGGWGQLQPAWSGRDDPEYQRFAALVEACVVPSYFENDRGWQPSHRQGAAEDWVLEAREQLRRTAR
ncbi:MAG: HzsA-related protein, partial [Planctomycetota bacterium]